MVASCYHSADETPLPLLQTVSVLLSLFAGSSQSSMLFSYVGFMVLDLSEDLDDESQIGFRAGLLASSFFLGNAVSGTLWGWLADKYGRRPVLLAGVAFSIVTSVGFGFSTSYGIALFWRVVTGLLNANFSVGKCYMSDITDATNRSRGFSFVSLAWGTGAIFGSAIGGYSARPALRYPGLFAGSLFDAEGFPYALPGLIGGAMSAGVLVLCYFKLPETEAFLLASGRYERIGNDDGGEDEYGGIALDSASASDEESRTLLSSEFSVELEGGAERGCAVNGNGSYVRGSEHALGNGSGLHSCEDAEESGHRSADIKVVVSVPADDSAVVTSVPPPPVTTKSYKPSVVAEDPASGSREFSADGALGSDAPVLMMSGGEASLDGGLSASGSALGAVAVFLARYKNSIIVALIYQLIAFVFISFSEMFGLWAINEPEIGGLGFDTDDIGVCFIITGVTLILFQLFCYPRLSKWAGALGSLRIGLFTASVSVFLVPMAHGALSLGSGGFWTVMAGLLVFRAVTGTICFTSVNVVLNRVAPPESVGRVNGAAYAGAGISKALGPSAMGTALVWSLATPRPFPFDFHFVWTILAFVTFVCGLATWAIPNESSWEKPTLVSIDGEDSEGADELELSAISLDN